MSDLDGKKFTKITGECPSCKTVVNNSGKCPGCGGQFCKDGTIRFRGAKGGKPPSIPQKGNDDQGSGKEQGKAAASGAKAASNGAGKDGFFSW